MRSKRFPKFGVLVASFLIVGAVAAPAGQANHQTIVGLTDEATSRLAFFSPGNPGANQLDTIIFPDAIDNDLVGIDYRPRANLLYGLGSEGSLYVLRQDPAPATTTTARRVNNGAGGLTASDYGFDFNPVADAIRLVGDDGSNRRISPDNGGIIAIDTPLFYAPGDPGQDPIADVTGAAYTNNFHGATSTTLFGIDPSDDTLVRQGGPDGNPSPNTGELTTVGSLGAGIDTSDRVGFDIETSFNNPTPTDYAYAALDLAGSTESTLHQINLTTGAATPLGTITTGGHHIESIALPLSADAKFDTLVTQAGEGNGPAVVTVTRSGRIDRTATIQYSTGVIAGDTATPGQDFTETSGTLTFPPNVSAQNITIPITDDSAAEPNESFQVNLGASSSNLLNSNANSFAKVVIVDNDGAAQGNLRPLLSIPAQSFRQVQRKVKAAFSCNRACNANLKLFAGKRKVSAVTSQLAQGGTRNVRFKIDAADRRLFNNRLTARGLKLTVKGVFRIPGGAVVRRTLTFRAHL